MFTVSTSIQNSSGSPSNGNQRRKRNKRNPNWNIRSKAVSIFRELILYIENPKDATRKLLDIISKLVKSEYKTNAQKSVAFLYTNNKRSEREIRETFPLTITLKRMKYLGINLPKEAKDLYSENHETLVKETEDM